MSREKLRILELNSEILPSKPLTSDLFSRRACYRWNASYRKNEEKKSCRKHLDLLIQFCSFLVHEPSKEATELAKKITPKFPWGPKLEAFPVHAAWLSKVTRVRGIVTVEESSRFPRWRSRPAACHARRFFIWSVLSWSLNFQVPRGR